MMVLAAAANEQRKAVRFNRNEEHAVVRRHVVGVFLNKGVVHPWVGQILLKCNDFKR